MYTHTNMPTGNSPVGDRLLCLSAHSNLPPFTYSHAHEAPSFIVLIVPDALS
jgi:hypothetical protein